MMAFGVELLVITYGYRITVFAVCSFQFDYFNTVSYGPVRTFYV